MAAEASKTQTLNKSASQPMLNQNAWKPTSPPRMGGMSPYPKYASNTAEDKKAIEERERKAAEQRKKDRECAPLKVGKAPQPAKYTKSITIMNMKIPRSSSQATLKTMVIPPFG